MPTEPPDAGSDADASGVDPGAPTEGERAPNTLLNGLLGGVVAVVLAFVPLSPALGGGLAGYLEGGDATAGATVGAIAGLVALVPFLFVVGIVLFFVPLVPVPGPRIHLALGVVVVFLTLLSAVYFVGLGLVGGVLGVYVREEL